jgi:hypothetical protein
VTEVTTASFAGTGDSRLVHPQALPDELAAPPTVVTEPE